jgi:hypothetical protein
VSEFHNQFGEKTTGIGSDSIAVCHSHVAYRRECRAIEGQDGVCLGAAQIATTWHPNGRAAIGSTGGLPDDGHAHAACETASVIGCMPGDVELGAGRNALGPARPRRGWAG